MTDIELIADQIEDLAALREELEESDTLEIDPFFTWADKLQPVTHEDDLPF